MCNTCLNDLEEKTEAIKAYVKKHPNAQLADISDATDCREEFVRQVFEKGGIAYPCSNCGAMIVKGNFCQDCTDAIQEALRERLRKLQAEKESSGMQLMRGTRRWD